MKNENVEIKTNEVNIDTVRSVANLTRKDWFAMFYEHFLDHLCSRLFWHPDLVMPFH